MSNRTNLAGRGSRSLAGLRAGAVVIAALASSACTAGLVLENGSALEGAEVRVTGCTTYPDTKVTYTDDDGYWSFNPYSPTSLQIDPDLTIPEGPLRIEVRSGGDAHVEWHHHDYSGQCDVLYNGVYGPQPCRTYVTHFSAMSHTDQLSVHSEFVEACADYLD